MTEPAAELPPGWPAMSLAQAHAALTAPGTKFEMGEADIRGVRTRIWKNAPPTYREVFLLSQTFPDREFIVYENDRATYPDFGKATLALAHEFQSQGIRKGDRIGLIMRNLPEFPVVF